MHISIRKQRKYIFVFFEYDEKKQRNEKIQTYTNIDSNKLISGRMVKMGLLLENCSFLFKMSRTHIATFILHSTSHFFFFFFFFCFTMLPIA